jgi:mannose-6-phosphate isomerase-like protein (cupin superfamily)
LIKKLAYDILEDSKCIKYVVFQMIENIKHNNALFAVIIYHTYRESGLHFFTPSDFSQQLAYMRHPAGKKIKPHIHNQVTRNVHNTQEVLYLRKGSVRIDFYDDDRSYIESRVLGTGDVILLAKGGHGLEVLEEAEIIEVKQGPFAGDNDKIRFEGVTNDKIKINRI